MKTLVYFFCALKSAWFSTTPQEPPRCATMHGEAIVRLIDSVPLSYARGEYNIENPCTGDTVLVNKPHGNDLQWAIIIELTPVLKNGCNEF